jgi:hypothetical protein
MMSTRCLSLKKKKIRYFNQVKYIMDETYRLLVNNDENKNRWREYFDKLFNEESERTTTELNDSFDDTNKRFVRRI